MNKKPDVADHYNAGRPMLANVHAVPLDAAPTIAPAAPSRLTLPIAEFLGDEDEADEPEDWTVDMMVPAGAFTFMAGPSESGKTFLALLMALCVPAGIAFLGRAVKPGPVVVLCEEDSQRRVRQRLWWLARYLGIDPRALPIRIAAMSGFRVEDAAKVALLESELEGAVLGIADCLTKMHSANENSRSEMQLVMDMFTRLTTSTGAALVVLHHYHKLNAETRDRDAGDKMRGSSVLRSTARSTIGVERAKTGEIMISAAGNYGQLEPFAARFYVEPPTSIPLTGDQKRKAWFEVLGPAKDVTKESAKSAIDARVLDYLRSCKEPVSIRTVRKEVGGRGEYVDAALRRLQERGDATHVNEPKEGWVAAKSGLVE